MSLRAAPRHSILLLTPLAAACMLAACGGDGGSNDSQATTFKGVVTAVAQTNDVSGNPKLKAGYYAGATVFVDANGNGVKDSGEDSTTTGADGSFSLTTANAGQLVADIPTSATNTATGAAVPGHLILRASAAQIADQGAGSVVISPMSSEVQRRVEANGTTYATEKANVATRLAGPAFNQGTASVTGDNVLSDAGKLSGATQYAVLYEDNMLANRYTYATAKLDRGDKYPDNLAVKGGDPRLVGKIGTAGTSTLVGPQETQSTITFSQAQQAAFNVEGVPAYDHIFVIMEENKSTDAILGNSRAPYINQLLGTYNQLTTYYSTGNPSEPNYTALGGGDDFGITDDAWLGCGATGANAPADAAFAGGTASDGQPLPATGSLPAVSFYPQLATAGYSYTVTPVGGSATNKTVSYADSSLNANFGATSCNTAANHNVPGPNLFTLVSKAGLTIRTYSESMNPGQDPRADSLAQNVAKAYTGTDTVGSNGTITDSQPYQLAAGLYKVKHGPSIAYQTARNLPEFFADNRTIFGSQYTAADWTSTSPYGTAKGGTYDTSKWIYDQFSADLAAGDVGNINFVVPDQCDDMHGVGDDSESCNGGANSNNGQNQSVTRADIYLKKVIDTIKASALWNNPQKRVAIVVMFDEGEGSSTSCCGWNAGGSGSGATLLTVDANNKATATTAPTNYSNGNHGHGNSIFGVITNQQDLGMAPKGVQDSDAYSHFSFVRTLQDMFQLADPAFDSTYLNRAKYTEDFIFRNITALPELQSSADTHFDAVRPINHAYVIPAGYVQKLNPADIGAIGSGPAVPVRTGADTTQANVWGTAR